MLPALPSAQDLLGDRGYDSNRFRAGLLERARAHILLGHLHGGCRYILVWRSHSGWRSES